MTLSAMTRVWLIAGLWIVWFSVGSWILSTMMHWDLFVTLYTMFIIAFLGFFMSVMLIAESEKTNGCW